MSDQVKLKGFISKKYASIALKKPAAGCCSSSCCCGGEVDARKEALKLGYSEADLASIPNDANMGLGCGNPVVTASLKTGETVLDLGCGGGMDCFLSRAKVGETGYVIGVDMTPEMVALARKNVEKSGYKNIDIRLGEIEHLPVADSSVDVIISNCVINLSLDKQQVLNEAHRVLKAGGRLCVSDIVATCELPDQIKRDVELLAGCVAGAELIDNLRLMLESAGFRNINLYPKEESREIIDSWTPGKNVSDYVASYIIEAIK